MDRSVAQGRLPESRPDSWTNPATRRWLAIAIGVALVLIALAVYTSTLGDRLYNHFVWQAAAYLEGQTAIRYPTPDNAFFQDVLPVDPIHGMPRGQLPFPPLPAVLLVPFVAIWGMDTADQLIFAVLGALTVGLCWWMLGRLRVRPAVRLGTTILFGFGTVFWYTSQLATTWFQAHIVAVALTMLAIGVALGGDRAAVEEDDASDGPAEDPGHGPDAEAALHPGSDDRRGISARAVLRAALVVDRRQFVAGFLFGLACTARLTVVFGAPFFLFVGAGGSLWRRGWSAGLGAIIPGSLLVAYNLATTGHVFHPAYEYLYQYEARVYWPLGYVAEWAIEDIRYIPQNLGIMFGALPVLFPATLPDSLGVSAIPVCTEPGAVRGLFDVSCPLAVPRDIGTSLIVTSPALLLALPALRRYGRSRLVTSAVLAIVLIAIVNLMHFSQGWVQFGYRFSNDFVPWALLLVAIGWERIADRRRWAIVAVLLVIASIGINLWGVVWGGLLGW